MSAIIDFFTNIGEVVMALIDFVIGTIKDVVYMVQLLGSTVASLPSLLGWLPTSCITLVVLGFSVVVIYKIIGREG